MIGSVHQFPKVPFGRHRVPGQSFCFCLLSTLPYAEPLSISVTPIIHRTPMEAAGTGVGWGRGVGRVSGALETPRRYDKNPKKAAVCTSQA